MDRNGKSNIPRDGPKKFDALEPMKLTAKESEALIRLLGSSQNQRVDGGVVYWAAESHRQRGQGELAIWDTQEPTGWTLKLANLDHLPAQMIQVASGTHFFLGGDQHLNLN